MIGSFADKATESLFHGRQSRHLRRFPPDIIRVAVRKLDLINAAHVLLDLRSPPGNRLELLRGDWSGYHSIRVNNQWRIVFRWANGQAHEVQLIDYHRG